MLSVLPKSADRLSLVVSACLGRIVLSSKGLQAHLLLAESSMLVAPGGLRLIQTGQGAALPSAARFVAVPVRSGQ
jgi:hypothetical protein